MGSLSVECMKRSATRSTTIDAHQRDLIAGAVAEVDPRQMAITRRLTPAQRVQQMLSMIELVENIAAHRLCQRQPRLNKLEALRMVRSRDVNY